MGHFYYCSCREMMKLFSVNCFLKSKTTIFALRYWIYFPFAGELGGDHSAQHHFQDLFFRWSSETLFSFNEQMTRNISLNQCEFLQCNEDWQGLTYIYLKVLRSYSENEKYFLAILWGKQAGNSNVIKQVLVNIKIFTLLSVFNLEGKNLTKPSCQIVRSRASKM